MPIRALCSGWSGRALLAAWSLVLSAALSGCAAWSHRASAVDHLDFPVQALQADSRAREQLWRDYGAAAGSDDAQLRAALLQSLPDHSGYDADRARARLDALAVKHPVSVDVASVARLRLAQMNENAGLRSEVAELKQRLARVVDIERRLNGK